MGHESTCKGSVCPLEKSDVRISNSDVELKLDLMRLLRSATRKTQKLSNHSSLINIHRKLDAVGALLGMGRT